MQVLIGPDRTDQDPTTIGPDKRLPYDAGRPAVHRADRGDPRALSWMGSHSGEGIGIRAILYYGQSHPPRSTSFKLGL